MVLQQRRSSAPPSDQTLASLWRTQAQRLNARTIAACIVVGTLGVIIPMLFGRAPFVALLSLIVAAFGSYAVVIQSSLGGRWFQPRVRGIIAGTLVTVAALAALVAGLLVLGMVFGGSMEVMRR